MKLHKAATSLLLAYCLCLGITVKCNAAEITSIKPDQKAISEVRQGKRQTAHAIWWGFDPQDATRALQAAIQSGALKVIVSNPGTPWIVEPIKLASNQEIVFEPNVVVQAKRGTFREKWDCLFTAKLKTNITLTGYGAKFQMWKQDYDSSAYEKSEWRHALSIRSCSNVKVLGLTIADSGGDGIYLGVSKKGVSNTDIHIMDVVCTNNYRQGISVISAQNLLIENCLLNNTSGTAPQAGIDFEPNNPSERLVNCVMRNCVSENNIGDAYTFYLKHMKATSAPVSIELINCKAIGGRQSVSISTGNDLSTTAVSGQMRFTNCLFEGATNSGIAIREKPASGLQVQFDDCIVRNAAVTRKELSPITLMSRPGNRENIGGIVFNDLKVMDNTKRLPIAYEDGTGVRITDIEGKMIAISNGRRTNHVLNQELIDTWIPQQAFEEIPIFEMQEVRFKPVHLQKEKKASTKCSLRQRGSSQWMLYVDKAGDKIEFDVLIQRVGRNPARAARVQIKPPSGKVRQLKQAGGDQTTSYKFQAAEAGAYCVLIEPGNSTAQINSREHRICALAELDTFHLLGFRGELYFWVPTGQRTFAVKVIGGGGIERVKAALHDASEKLVEAKDNIDRAVQFVVKRDTERSDEIWSLRLNKPSAGVLEDYYVQLEGIPPVLACSAFELMKAQKNSRKAK